MNTSTSSQIRDRRRTWMQGWWPHSIFVRKILSSTSSCLSIKYQQDDQSHVFCILHSSSVLIPLRPGARGGRRQMALDYCMLTAGLCLLASTHSVVVSNSVKYNVHAASVFCHLSIVRAYTHTHTHTQVHTSLIPYVRAHIHTSQASVE